ncbi:tRNA-(ms[2]io[6]A)-hydroxylase [Gammaproteobacteria bacterium LSUCC0057]|uniref:tRNA-(Ms[2]io[6]A)-hydroxylase n=1 Tax=Gammaproteobacteria bacterium LSUCC0057 TaxID=2559237 RepID=A0A4Y8UJC2_9GAMM|nr:tRNA-(ms[2]io[6]A)-hydroxylase [Gammaproteobacteria bacterium LSUCC0057]
MLSEIHQFLPCATPEQWLDDALAHPDILLIDHANCEKKAASTAMNLIYRYTDDFDLLNKMSRLAREELRHFEQVLALMKQRGIDYRHVEAARYAAGLRAAVRNNSSVGGREQLVDILVVGAFIEARSCERFAALAPRVDAQLGDFYRSLLKSESRHYKDYLTLASRYAEPQQLAERIALFRQLEGELIVAPDQQFRFHSGPLAA